jgi:hypothetical protein
LNTIETIILTIVPIAPRTTVFSISFKVMFEKIVRSVPPAIPIFVSVVIVWFIVVVDLKIKREGTTEVTEEAQRAIEIF